MAAGLAQTRRPNIIAANNDLGQAIAHLIGFFLYGMEYRGNLTIFCARTLWDSGSANFPMAGSSRRHSGEYNYQVYRSAILDVGGSFLLKRVIRRANQRTGFDMRKTHLLAELFILGEFIWVDIAHDGQVLASGLQILAEG